MKRLGDVSEHCGRHSSIADSIWYFKRTTLRGKGVVGEYNNYRIIYYYMAKSLGKD